MCEVSKANDPSICGKQIGEETKKALYKGKLYTITDNGSLFAHEVTEDIGNGELRVSWIERR